MVDELSGGMLSGDNILQQLAELSKLCATTDGDTTADILRTAARTFNAEGALLWMLDDSGTALERSASFHEEAARSKAFEQESGDKALKFGQGLAGLAWAEGKVKVMQLPGMFAQSSHTGNVDTTSVCTVAFPIFGGAKVIGVLELVNCTSEICDGAKQELIQMLCTFIGACLFAAGASGRLQVSQGDSAQMQSKLRQMENQVRDLKSRLSKEHDQSVQNARYHVQFLSSISRDIRTQLSGITSIIELLQRGNLSDEHKEYVEIVKESAQTVLSVLEEVVEFNRHETEQFFPAVASEPSSTTTSSSQQPQEPVHASEQLKKARVLVVNGLLGSAEFIEAYATASGIKCEGASRGQTAITAMKQAVIISKPYDIVFVERLLPDMDAFELARRIKQEKTLADSKLVLVSTFDSASRDDQALKAGFTEHIAKPMKQQQVISVLSSLLQGRPQVEVSEQSDLVKEQIAPAVARGQRMILIAEDNPVNQKVALLQLRELGFFATVVANGQEAIDVLKQADFDAVLMDCQMPVLDGFEATKAIRQWEKSVGKHVPIIAMTAGALSSDREKCLAVGMDDYLSKPVTYDKLDSVLSKWVGSELAKKLAGEKTMQEPGRETQEFGVPGAIPVDVQGLSELLGPEEAVEVLHLFVNSTEELIEQIRDASTRRDSKQLKEAAHQLKGAASSVGANTIARACLELEQCAKNDEWDLVPRLNDGLAQNFQNAKSYIQTLNS
jgi:CheY-like chemotaxis protein